MRPLGDHAVLSGLAIISGAKLLYQSTMTLSLSAQIDMRRDLHQGTKEHKLLVTKIDGNPRCVVRRSYLV